MILINQTGSHNKFWIGQVNGKTAVCRWGRIGSRGQSSEIVHPSEALAKSDVSFRAHSKMAKGYVETTEKNLEELHLKAQVIGLANSCETCWAEIVGNSIRRANPSHLLDPSKEFGIFIHLVTKKKYNGKNSFAVVYIDGKPYCLEKVEAFDNDPFNPDRLIAKYYHTPAQKWIIDQFFTSEGLVELDLTHKKLIDRDHYLFPIVDKILLFAGMDL